MDGRDGETSSGANKDSNTIIAGICSGGVVDPKHGVRGEVEGNGGLMEPPGEGTFSVRGTPSFLDANNVEIVAVPHDDEVERSPAVRDASSVMGGNAEKVVGRKVEWLWEAKGAAFEGGEGGGGGGRGGGKAALSCAGARMTAASGGRDRGWGGRAAPGERWRGSSAGRWEGRWGGWVVGRAWGRRRGSRKGGEGRGKGGGEGEVEGVFRSGRVGQEGSGWGRGEGRRGGKGGGRE